MNLPIDRDTREWIDVRAAWIVSQFGMERLCVKKTVLPTIDFLPQDLEPTENGLGIVFDRVCVLMDIDRSQVEIGVYQDGCGSFMPTTLGLYEETSDGVFHIWIEASLLNDLLGVVATIAHELGHVHLLGHGRVDAMEDDHEHLTDLLTVFLGFGIITSNASLVENHERSGNFTSWQIGRRGYLDMQAYGYALAVYAAMRGDMKPQWRRYLRPDVRGYFERSVRYLEQYGLPNLAVVRTTAKRPKNHVVHDQEDEIEIPDGVCTFCGTQHGNVAAELCDLCRESIEANEREIDQEETEQELVFLWYEKFYKILGLALVIGFIVSVVVSAF